MNKWKKKENKKEGKKGGGIRRRGKEKNIYRDSDRGKKKKGKDTEGGKWLRICRWLSGSLCIYSLAKPYATEGRTLDMEYLLEQLWITDHSPVK